MPANTKSTLFFSNTNYSALEKVYQSYFTQLMSYLELVIKENSKPNLN